MSPFIVLTTAIVVLIVAMYYLGIWCNLWPSGSILALFKREYAYGDDSEEAVEVNPEEAVEVNDAAPTMAFSLFLPIETRDYIAELEWRRANLRAKFPHLYQDDWYRESRREYSIHAVRHAEERAAFRKEMGLAA